MIIQIRIRILGISKCHRARIRVSKYRSSANRNREARAWLLEKQERVIATLPLRLPLSLPLPLAP